MLALLQIAAIALVILVICGLDPVLLVRLLYSTGSALRALWRWCMRHGATQGPACRKCGYPLDGLLTHRCPECGTSFGADGAPAGHGDDSANRR